MSLRRKLTRPVGGESWRRRPSSDETPSIAKICALVPFSKGVANYDIPKKKQLFYVLDENCMDIILLNMTIDEINTDKKPKSLDMIIMGKIT